MTSPELTYIACAVIAVTLSGLGKGGFVGLGALAMPVMALSVNPVQGAAILLPILVVQDTVGVWAFRHNWDSAILLTMLPGMTLGVVLGYFLAATVSDHVVAGVVGGLSLVFGLYRLWSERGSHIKINPDLPNWMGSIFGIAAGFASQVAHAGGPPFQMWVIARRLPREVLVGTTAIAFAVMNVIKIPAYLALGQLTAANLLTSAMLLPVALASTAAGIILVRRMHPERFYKVIYVLMALLGLQLLFSAVRS